MSTLAEIEKAADALSAVEKEQLLSFLTVRLQAGGKSQNGNQAVHEKPLAKLAARLEQLPRNPDWPADGAAQHDHYLYGAPKRS